MAESQYSLAWDSYKTSICHGFSSLQQNSELVDMTLAADGHFVKVHQVLIALSSTYLKNLITSAPCPHPIIFLNNVSHKVLSFLLEYIYTGEVLVPSEYLMSFTEAAKALHIKGLENIANMDNQASVEINTVNSLKRRAPIDIDQMKSSTRASKVLIKPEGADMSENQNLDISNDSQDYNDTLMDDSGTNHYDDDYIPDADDEDTIDTDQVKANTSNLLYTVSIRGSLQVILNRYIYNSTTTRKGFRRWRCVEYRDNKCTAFIVTKGNVVVNRANLHNHPFHDKKILSKIEKKAVFSHLDEIEGYKAKTKAIEEADTVSQEDGEDFTIENFNSDNN